MIRLTRLNGEDLYVNAGLIEFIEVTPDTLISLATGKKIMVRETVEQVVERAIAYYRQIGHVTVLPPSDDALDAEQEEHNDDE